MNLLESQTVTTSNRGVDLEVAFYSAEALATACAAAAGAGMCELLSSEGTTQGELVRSFRAWLGNGVNRGGPLGLTLVVKTFKPENRDFRGSNLTPNRSIQLPSFLPANRPIHRP